MSRKARASGSQRRRTAAPRASRTPWLIGIGVVATVAVVAVMAVVLASGEPAVAEPATEPVTVSGTPLPERPVDGDDPAVGMSLPTLAGTDLSGEAMTIGSDGQAQAIIVLAHWCPHCRNEVPRLVAWLTDNPVPEGVELVGVATLADPARPNYPASEWLANEGWEVPTLNDDAALSAYYALGGMGTPGFVFVSSDGVVQLRMTGEIDVETFGAILEELAP